MSSTEVAVKRVLREFADGTSMHGVPRIINARSLPAKVFWSVICLGAFAMFFWQCGILLEKYFSYPKKVNVEIVQQPVQFPAVTVCNSDHIDLVVMHRIEQMMTQSPDNATSLDASDEVVWREFKTKYGHFVDNSSNFFQSYMWYAHGERKPMSSLYDIYSRHGLTANLGRRLATDVGVRLHDFVVSCQFMGEQCNVTASFVKFFDPYYFNCYTFQPQSVLSSRGTRLQGVEYGLSVLLFTGSAGQLDTSGKYVYMVPGVQESDSSLASGRGARVVVHSPDTQPYPTVDGYDIMPGYSVTIRVKANEMLRIQRPHGNCSHAPPRPGGRAHAFKYTLTMCQNKCIHRAIMGECRCVDNSISDLVAESLNMSYCSQLPVLPASCALVGQPGGNLTDACRHGLQAFDRRATCRRHVYERMTIRDPQALAHCGCFPPCRDFIYDASYSLSTMPEMTDEHTTFYMRPYEFIGNLSPVRVRILKHKLGLAADDVLQYPKAFIRAHLSRLNVHIADGNVVKTTESPDYDTTRLVSDIGGQLGLWIGISVMTLFEVLQLLADVLRFLTVRGRSAGEKRHSRGGRGGDGGGGRGGGGDGCGYCGDRATRRGRRRKGDARCRCQRYANFDDRRDQYLSNRCSDGDVRMRYEIDKLTAV